MFLRTIKSQLTGSFSGVKKTLSNRNCFGFSWQAALVCCLILLASSAFTFGQSNNNNSRDDLIPGREPDNQPRTVKEFLAKQRAEKAKKDHEELLKRGEEVTILAEQLETAFERNNHLTSDDLSKLESLEKLVTRIRKSLGGDDDDETEKLDDGTAVISQEKPAGTLKEAFQSLKETTSKLVDELKKTSRFTVSALAIQSSNSVLKIVRFLRLRK